MGAGGELEHPRYRLAQVFEWVVAMMVARYKGAESKAGGEKALPPRPIADDAEADASADASDATTWQLAAEGQEAAAIISEPESAASPTPASAAAPEPEEAESHSPVAGSATGTERGSAGYARAAAGNRVAVTESARNSDSLIPVDAVKPRSSSGGHFTLMQFTDDTVQDAADSAARSLKVLSSEFLASKAGRGKRSAAARKHA